LIQKEGEFPTGFRPEKGGFAVKKKRFAVEQIVAILKQTELGIPIAELIRQVGISGGITKGSEMLHSPMCTTDGGKQF
jgi:hypothetical protein